MNTATLIQKQLLATKFFVPVTSGTLIRRPRLIALLEEGLKHPFTLVSAPAGFGKTTLLSTWAHSLQAPHARLCWLSLDEEDNDPRLFWTYVLTALDVQGSQRFEPLLMHLQSQPPPPLKPLLIALVNLLAESQEHFALILDDYQLITQEQVHTTLAYLLERLPAQLRIVVSTRADPPLPLPLLRARRRALEIRTEQLRCTVEETGSFLEQVMGSPLPDETIQQVTVRTEGWLVGLQLLGLSLPKRADPLSLLQEVSGNQRYILDYLTEVVLQRQPQEVQTFLLSTCILERLTAPLCDAVMQQTGSQRMLERLEQANLFVVSLDSRRQWYRYHALFAEALQYHLEQTHADLLPVLHHRASLWYAEHDQSTEAILHAFKAHEWQWTADLIERRSWEILTYTWRTKAYQLVLLQHWLEQMPIEIMGSRPRLCLTCASMLWSFAPFPLLNGWLDVAEATLTTSLTTQIPPETSPTVLSSQACQEQEDLLGQVLTWRAILHSRWEDHGQSALLLCQRALSLLSVHNFVTRACVSMAKMLAYCTSVANDAMVAVECGLQGVNYAQRAEQPVLAITFIGLTVHTLIETGQLRKAQHLIQQAEQSSSRWSAGSTLPEMGFPVTFQAEILRERNELETARRLIEEALSLMEQFEAIPASSVLFYGYGVLLRITLSCGELEQACSALHNIEQISMNMNQPYSLYFHSLFVTIGQVRLWLACGELDRATHWAGELDLKERCDTPFAREREEVACVRVQLAQKQPAPALKRLEPVLQRATEGRRWGHVIEIRLLQALACQMHQQERQALDALSEAVRLAEPEGYIRSFVDEGAPMETLLSQLRQERGQARPTPYLDTVLAAFAQQSKEHAHQPQRAAGHSKAQPLLEPLSERELQVLQLLAHGASNLEIAHELVIVVDTVKRHVSHIFGKLDVQNRVQAVRRAQELGLFDEDHL